MTAIYFSKQKALATHLKAIQKIHFSGNLLEIQLQRQKWFSLSKEQKKLF